MQGLFIGSRLQIALLFLFYRNFHYPYYPTTPLPVPPLPLLFRPNKSYLIKVSKFNII